MAELLYFAFLFQFFLVEIFAKEIGNYNGTLYGPVKEGKIIGGQDAEEGEVPWMVSVKKWSNGNRRYEHYCGGSIINAQWVVSAAHCFLDPSRPQDLLLVVGTIKRDGEGGDNYEVQSIKNHEDFNPENFDNDIALLKIKNNFLFKKPVRSIFLGTEEMCRKPGLMGIVAGFGRIVEGECIFKENLQTIEIPIISNDECEKWFKSTNLNVVIKNDKLCAGYKEGGKNSCINAQWVVSAAHCFSDPNRPQDYLLVVGTINIDGEGGDSYEVQSIKNHEGYSPDNHDNDIALLKSKSNFLFKKSIGPISLGTEEMCRKPGLMGIVAGFGTTEEGKPKDKLQTVEIPIINNIECQEWYNTPKTDNVVINDNHLCAGYKEGGKDSCQGDSGGPLYIRNGDESYQCGVVSFGIGCALQNRPGVYASIGYFRDWIDENIQENS
ncbi:LOW QUALITY PROTEIN: trypsin-like [Centruroides sculpturatus]|uniref:LOW QUALITY PROTEIN: trypsin-like n=1 Tax=Centruroides sculpturatus TaxID=218467 RepID=UPI000C6DDC7E|nr:LOW QUALITY PROTEIN: trypsin-like [Centruroides sculpturatus]